LELSALGAKAILHKFLREKPHLPFVFRRQKDNDHIRGEAFAR